MIRLSASVYMFTVLVWNLLACASVSQMYQVLRCQGTLVVTLGLKPSRLPNGKLFVICHTCSIIAVLCSLRVLSFESELAEPAGQCFGEAYSLSVCIGWASGRNHN